MNGLIEDCTAKSKIENFVQYLFDISSDQKILKIILEIHDVTNTITIRAEAKVPSRFRAISPRVAFGLTASF